MPTRVCFAFARMSVCTRVGKRHGQLKRASASDTTKTRVGKRRIEAMLAYHSIFGTYGFWLPNDPRGSGSEYVASRDLFRFGKATKVTTRQSVAHRPSDPAWQQAARQALEYPAIEFTGVQAKLAAQGFAAACETSGYRIYACSVLPARTPCHWPTPPAHPQDCRPPEAERNPGAKPGRPLEPQRAAGLGRSRLERLPGPAGRRRAGDPLCRGKPNEGRQAAAAVAVCRAV